MSQHTTITALTMQQPTPSLLGIPPELRTIIYSYIFHLPLEIKPMDGIWLERRSGPWPKGLCGSQVIAHELHPHSLNHTIPWLQLAKSCKILAKEVQDYMASRTYLSAPENEAWTLKIRPDEFPLSASIARVRWTKIPCAPKRVRRLVINVNGTSKGLVLALSLAAYCGLRMSRKRPAAALANLDELIVNVLSPRTLVFPEHRYGFEPVDESSLDKSEFLAVKEALVAFQASKVGQSHFGSMSVYGGRGEEVHLDAQGHVR